MFIKEVRKSLTGVLKELQITTADEEVALEHPLDRRHGDYSANFAIAKFADYRVLIPDCRSPQEFAEKIVKRWKEIGLPERVEKVEVAGAGFINIWLKITALSKHLTEVLEEADNYGKSEESKGKTVVIDYSAPNIAKPFGIGHLRSTNIGQAIYNLYRFCGYKTIGDNHLGDWGTQFGKLIYQIELKVKNEKLEIEELTIDDLERLYVEFHQKAEKDPVLEEEARTWFKKLEQGDVEAKRIWQICVEISLKEFDRVYKLLGVKIDYTHGESFYLEKMEVVINDCRGSGILKESQGAQVVEIPGMEVPAMLVKSDGATTYLLRDLATIKYRRNQWQPDLYIYEVGADQSFHFRQLFAVAEMLGYGKKNQFEHVAHGLIRWPTGKFSTRKGETIHLEEVLNEAIERAYKLCEGAGVAKKLSTAERKEVARKIGIGAIKYNDLKQNPRTDVIFDWDQMLSLSGNSGPYLQYTYARTQSVLRKAKDLNFKFEILNLKFNVGLLKEEIELLRTFYRFSEVVEEAAREFSPNILCNFLFDLAQKFNLFYDKQRIIGSDSEEFRLLLTAGVGQVLKNGLVLLGIEPLEKM